MRYRIPEHELSISFARSSGRGGQNVNKLNTKVHLRWNIGASPSVTADEKTRIRAKLSRRINLHDELVVSVESERSQAQNRQIAVRILNELVNRALIKPKHRIATRPTRASKEKRLERKKYHSRAKRERKNHEM